MLPKSDRSCVLMYFLSGQINRYAPMFTSCFSPSDSASPVFSPPTYSAVPSTHTSASRHVSPLGLLSTAASPLAGRVSSAGYPPLHRFSMF